MSQDKKETHPSGKPSHGAPHAAERRRFMLGTLAALPAASLLSACGEQPSSLLPGALDSISGELRPDASAHGSRPGHRQTPCHDEAAQAHQRARWRELLEAHVGAENLHDLDVILETFADDGEMVFNGNVSSGDDQLSSAHIMFGFSGAVPGGLTRTQVIAEREHFTDDAILIEGRVVGEHVRAVGIFPPTFRRVTLPYSAFYRFDAEGKLVSERIVMDFTPLALPPPT